MDKDIWSLWKDSNGNTALYPLVERALAPTMDQLRHDLEEVCGYAELLGCDKAETKDLIRKMVDDL